MVKISYTDIGYTKKSITDLIREKEILYESLMGIINNSISSIQWHWIKNSLYERQEIEDLHSIGAEQMSISDASGVFLNKHGIECGITRKKETKAQGYVEVSTPISGKEFVILANTTFTSQLNSYNSDEENIIPYEITMSKTRTGESDDYFEATITYVGAIEEIRDSSNNIIDSSYYTLDSTYHNNIQWTVGSSDILIVNEPYTVRVSGLVTKRVEVSSLNTGAGANTSIGTVTVCVQYPSLTVTNEEEINGGDEQETNDAYRTRLLDARRRTFTIGNIKSIILGTEGVRATKVFQNVGTDQSSVDDWDNPITGAMYTITGTTPIYSQNFVPGNHILTLGRITLYGNAINDPPAIICGIKRNIDETGTGTTSPYFDFIKVEKWDLDQTVIGMRDIEFNINYNGLDHTKTYRFDVFCDNPGHATFDWNTNYWQLAVSLERYGTGPRKELYTLGSGGVYNGLGDDIDLMFKSSFKGAGYTVVVATSDGYGFTNVRQELTGLLDYIGASENPGYSPVAIQSQVVEATEIDIDVRVVIYVSALAEFENVRRELEESIEEYLEALDVGSNVTYSRIFQVIMDHAQIVKLEDLFIKRTDSNEWVQRDVGITDSEIPDLGTRSIQLGN